MTSKLYGMIFWVMVGTIPLIPLASAFSAPMVAVDGATRFQDDFENDVNQSEPQHPEVGSWDATTNLYSHVLTATSQITDPGGSTLPGSTGPASAFGGNQFLRLIKPGGAAVAADFSAITPPVSGSHSIVATFAMYIPSTDGIYTASAALSASTTYPGSPAFVYAGPANQVLLTNGSTNNPIPTGGGSGDLTYQNDVWQVWQIDYTMDAGAGNDTFTVSVDGVTSDPLQPTNASTGSHLDPSDLQYLLFSTGNTGAFFIDAVPEPTSLGLLVIGGVTLLRRRRA